MFGIVRPCAHRLGERLKVQWMAHLCGLCLALRADHGQLARIVTNYDGLLVSVLTEAQARPGTGGDARRTAGPCPLRGMRTASVAQGEGARLAAAVSLVLAAAKMRDHAADGDGLLARRPVARTAHRLAGSFDRAGARSGAAVGFDTAVLVAAVDRQTGIEALAGPGTPLLTVTEPTETATAAAFAYTAELAGRPGNAAPLAEAGRLFGRLAHLLDAVEDQADDAARGAWDPLTATGTSRTEARRLADDAVHGIRLALRDAEFTDGRLAHLLLVHELPRSVDRAFGTASCTHEAEAEAGRAAHGPQPGPGPNPNQYPGPNPNQYPGPYPNQSPGPYPNQSPGRFPPAPGGPFGPGPGFPPPEPPRRRRNWFMGCLAATGLCCTCRLCCAKEFEGPWSGRRHEGACRDCDCDCCDCCQCCDCNGCDGCDCCDCDCGCDC